MNIRKIVGYLTPIEVLEIDGREVTVAYNSITTMFNAIVDGRRLSNCALKDLRVAIAKSLEDGASLDVQSRGWLEDDIERLDGLIRESSPETDHGGISLKDRREIDVSCLSEIHERESIRADVAACEDFLRRLPETRIIERLGFESRLKEAKKKLSAKDLAQLDRMMADDGSTAAPST